MKNVYVVLSHRHGPNQLAIMQAWTDEGEAEKAAQLLRELFGCPSTAIEVRRLACS